MPGVKLSHLEHLAPYALSFLSSMSAVILDDTLRERISNIECKDYTLLWNYKTPLNSTAIVCHVADVPNPFH